MVCGAKSAVVNDCQAFIAFSRLWAARASGYSPEAPVCLDIYAGSERFGQVVADRYRADLQAAGIGDGRHGFEFVPPAGLAFAPGAVTVRRSRDGAVLSPSSALARHLAGGPRRVAEKATGR
jgi:hypothetical protein